MLFLYRHKDGTYSITPTTDMKVITLITIKHIIFAYISEGVPKGDKVKQCQL